MSQIQGSADRPQFRARVYGYPAATRTGYGWSYELLDMSKPADNRIVMLGCRWTWRQALRDALADLAARAEGRNSAIGP